MEPTLKQFRAFVAVAETGQFTRAAERLGLSQSAVSTLIGQLETNLGLRLFDRHTRLLRLTQAGTEALAVARQAVGDLDRLVENARELNDFSRGRVTIASGTLQAALTLPRLIKGFHLRYPNIDVSMHDVPERVVIEMVKSGAADLGLGTVSERDSEVVGTELLTDAFLVVMRPEHPLAQRSALRWQDLAEETLIGPQRGNPIRERLEAEMARIGMELKLHRSLQVALPLTIIGMVEAGLGVAVMTSTVKPLAHSVGLVTIMPSEPVIARKISLIQRSDNSLAPACRLFREFVQRAIQTSPRGLPA
ncbi:LysR family transcriptional regulator [Paracoccus sp. CPCC 101403]|uniref:LysR family transcriptional regulator n=1 Tax=Paracoccus broussonetiae TaxID=3075834 RepID=A0ABU3EJW3_9RHOB|nr:LysR family transcriptional regulator [Paracoccus sp. CPCC 101403]MDT1064549.1 LysR family transcriptional regulator [Paracoccus sp. CPCC 101403]